MKWTWQQASYRFKVGYVLWAIFLLALLITSLAKKPDGPQIGDPFDKSNPYHP